MKNLKTFITRDVKEVKEVAQYVLDHLTKSKLVLMNGDLGAGKTTLTKEIAKLLNIDEVITSPTFNYMKVYDGLVHIDAYNLKGDISEFEDYFEDNVVVIEWANRIKHYYKNYLDINITLDKDNNHVFTIKEAK
ncbi:tRNA (adenosine(37)-N6)-threonylcarbamoyltransferase complex ATPase subunit type 1 TsaE [Mycoplasmopsis fermentans]|uniref:tRNA (adenosine(37)-N6)-threonylcarbamoyltransferase complex ATPase subunit type 1 TsaE n=1 Tax=Mycoplasmopsis fermentans TaxID=2115 RepID=UPI000F0289B2|nr:tRNA (adenosine(37)-N6)-threonylcarbamoyltransferase complex ATPase subunit type 1 TsaE [Mycoplasmopsis fermentans]RMX36059.1 tRNA threonylcarbamoyl adenosine modification protein YjeE [Mycoplasmopsis fermentans MF-I2]RMX36129.1 tRNA threonylcarbamoyl adenosine modification protein YjeE [Mycoplasmopsis fermentans MF-I1]